MKSDPQTMTDAMSSDTPRAQSVAFIAHTNVDEQARVFEGWNLNYIQISKGRFHGASWVVSLRGIRLLVEDLDKVILQRGAVPADRLAIAVPLELEGHARMCGVKSERDSLHVFSSLPEFEFYSPDRHVLINVEVEPKALRAGPLQTLAETLRAKTLAPIVPMTAEAAEMLRALLKQALSASAGTPHAGLQSSPERIELLERTILYAIHEALLDAPQAIGNLTKHWMLVNAVQERLQDFATCPLSIAELCVQLNVSRRTIQYAFQDALGINPIMYLRAVRLNHVRRELKQGETVTAAATKWGFWHLGSFASDYRNMFGELPSSTAKRYAGEAV
jgi:AraC family transcriptional regulator, ethanolamine operon transcriptional activator